jgi:hypothetical protein
VTVTVALAAVLIGGVWLRWAVAPVIAAYWIGRRVELAAARRRGGRGA